MNSRIYTALCGIAAAVIDPQSTDQLKAALKPIKDWQALADQVEFHGLSVMLGQLANQEDLGLPRNLRLQLKALTVRHQKVLMAREIILADVINIFEQNHISFALLKGAALSSLIYDPPWLRPMRDVDILVSKKDAQHAQKLLRDIGFSNEDFNSGYLYEHHHLPNSTRTQNGFTISLEVHHDALSGDVADSITFDSLIDPLQRFELVKKQVSALGHRDMLKHLCYHTFEPADIIKLGSIVDLILYANTFAGKIDWPTLERTQPAIPNTLRCIHALIALPDPLRSKLGNIPDNWQPGGIGQGFTPLSKIINLGSISEKARALLAPSDWWMHVHYVIAPNKPLTFVRFIRHPSNIVKWLWRRQQAKRKSERN